LSNTTTLTHESKIVWKRKNGTQHIITFSILIWSNKSIKSEKVTIYEEQEKEEKNLEIARFSLG